MSHFSDTLWTIFASVRLTVVLLSFLAATVLVGAWCPQESQVGQEKVIEAFGPDFASFLIKAGVADIFHSFWFLLLIGMLTINIVVGSIKYVFPKLRLLVRPMPLLSDHEIAKLPFYWQRVIESEVDLLKEIISGQLKKRLYTPRWTGNLLTADFGKFGRLAPSITHVGLLTLLAGVTITAWTGFSGFKPVLVGSEMSFDDSQHANPWVGKLPDWRLKINSSRREDYPNGEAKQWYSNLTVVDRSGRRIKTQDISVNNPLSYQGVDIYQSSWGLGQLNLEFNGHKRALELRPMGKLYAAFLPLVEESVLIFSVRNQEAPLRIFAKRSDWSAPRLLGEVPPGKELALGSVVVRYTGSVPITGLQYKCDPGLAVTFTAFGLIILGVTLATVPHRQLWAELVPATAGNNSHVLLKVGGTSPKAKVGFEQQMIRFLAEVQSGQVKKTFPEKSKQAKKTETANV